MVFENWLNVLIKPKQVFAEEKPNASLKKAVIITFVAGIISGIFYIIANYIYISFFSLSYSSDDFFFRMPLLFPENPVLSFIALIVLTPIGFLIFSGLLYGIAKSLGGTGNFTAQTHLIALFQAPCAVIASALKIIPFFGAVLGFLVGIYGLYLLTLALRETHQYSTGKAIITWVISYVILFVIVFVITIIWFISSNTRY